MSETVKLIIEIPNHLYHVIKNKECTNKNVLTKAVENGIPLDDVKAKIELLQSERYYFGFDTCKNRVLEIIDSIGKAESEVKPNK